MPSTDFLSIYNKTLEPLIRNEKGGILKETQTEAAITSDYLFKLLLIGNSGVGKSCMLMRYSENKFT